MCALQSSLLHTYTHPLSHTLHSPPSLTRTLLLSLSHTLHSPPFLARTPRDQSIYIFAPGQMYVGLSRARNLEGLRVTGLHKNALKIEPKVEKFYKQMFS